MATDRDALTTAELDVLQRLALGDDVPAIARDTYRSADTIKGHCQRLYRKLGVENRHAAVWTGLSLGIIAPPMSRWGRFDDHELGTFESILTGQGTPTCEQLLAEIRMIRKARRVAG